MATTLILASHIIGGAVGILTGAMAMTLRKGSARHRVAGQIFSLALLVMCGTGAVISFQKSVALSFLNAVLTFYMVFTAWLVLRRRPSQNGLIEWVLLLVIVAVACGLFLSGSEALGSENGLKDGFPAVAYFVFGTIAATAALLDCLMLARGGVAGRHRLVRHLWRMGFALWMIVTSFFLGQARLLPDWIYDKGLHLLPVALVTLMTVYWLIRTLWMRRGKQLATHSA